jgi:predicted transglutaminase-like cysteine proteinase
MRGRQVTFDDLKRVNGEINELPYKTDLELYGKPDVWERITDVGAGDCEDFALGKLRALLALGWPISVMRLCFCMTEMNEPHGVLLVDFEGQTWVLDNRQPTPTTPQDLKDIGYEFKSEQIAGSTIWKAYT